MKKTGEYDKEVEKLLNQLEVIHNNIHKICNNFNKLVESKGSQDDWIRRRLT